MISIITWVNNQTQYDGLLCSLRHVSHEAIAVRDEAHSMAEAYNLGTKRANNDVLVYCHQDVRIRDTEFERIVEESCKLPGVGWCGVAGSAVVTDGRPWWEETDDSLRGWLLQNDVLLAFGCVFRANGIMSTATSQPVRRLDGLLLATSHAMQFPEDLPGIHYLDAWMCAEAELLGLHNFVIPTLVQHLSWGEVSTDFALNRKQYEREFIGHKARRPIWCGSAANG